MLIRDMVDRWLLDHPVIDENNLWRKRALLVNNTLYDLYQLIGDEHLTAPKTA